MDRWIGLAGARLSKGRRGGAGLAGARPSKGIVPPKDPHLPPAGCHTRHKPHFTEGFGVSGCHTGCHKGVAEHEDEKEEEEEVTGRAPVLWDGGTGKMFWP